MDGYQLFGTLAEGLTLETLIDLLKKADHAVRWRAAKALFELGPAARHGTATLIEIMRDGKEDSLLRWWAAEALSKIGAEKSSIALNAEG
jgi:HEAT repeat protein